MNKKALALFLAALLVASTVSCGKKDETPMQPDEQPPQTTPENPPSGEKPGEKPNDPVEPTPNENAGITLNKTEHEMECGESFTIVATFVPKFDADDTTLTYRSSDEIIVSVTAEGVVTALAAGQAEVVVENSTKEFSKTITFTVKEKQVDPPPANDDPTPVKTEYLTIHESELFLGNLILVNPTYSTPVGGAAPLVNIRQHTTSTHLRVSLSKHEVTKETLDALSKMAEDFFAAFSESTRPKDILISQAHRTDEDQQTMIDNNTDTTAVGHSDFQTGLSVNLKFYDGTFTYFIGDNAASAESNWLMEHYAEYGFILRYPAGKKAQTGYDTSYSHFRYVGVPHSLYMKEYNLCLEEYLELLKEHSMTNPLQFTHGETNYSVYYIASQGENTTLPIPVFDENVNYSYTGNNHDGFIVTVEAHWEEGSFDPSLPTPNENPGITLDKTEHTLETEDSFTLGATFVPLYNTDNKTLVFSSSDPSVATVDQNGLVTALKEGQVTITVRNTNGKYTASCVIQIQKKAPKPNENPGITLNETEVTLETGDYYQIHAVFVPTFDTDNTMLVYSVEGNAITVDGTGKVFAKEVGTAVITVKNLDSTYIATLTVNVTKGANINAGIILDKSTLTVEEESRVQLEATFIPKYDTDNTSLYYEVSDPSVATVDENGVITAVKYGQTIIIIRNENGEYRAECTVIVTEKPNPNAGIVLEKSEVILPIGESETIVPTLTTEFDDDNRMLIYASADPSIASVNGLGQITAHKAGIVTITVKNITGKYKTTCTVYVPNPDAKLTLDKTELTLMEEDSGKITATFIPVFVTDSMVLTYVSSDTDILTVDLNGHITAVHYGTATVTVTSADGAFTATCTVTVTEKPDPNAGITLDQSEITLNMGESATLNATFIPVFDADSILLTFDSEDGNVVSVDENGKITAIAPGIVTVTVSNENRQFQKTVTVYVPNPNAGINVNESELSLEEGQGGKVEANYIPVYDIDDTTLTYLSSDEAILKVNADGSFTTHGYGVVTITVTNADGKFSAVCTVTITEKPDPNAGITLDASEITLEEGQDGKINATFIPVFDADDTALTFVSSDETILKVNADGSFTTLRYGVVTITVTNADGKFSAVCTVTVTEKPDANAGITLDTTEITLNVGESTTLNATFVPVYDADSTVLTYISENEAIVSVDENGKITANAPGIVTVTVQNTNGQFQKTVTVSVPDPNAGITLDKNEISVEEGEGGKVQATFTPIFQGDDATLTFASSDGSILKVNQDGSFVTFGYGVVTVTVTSADGEFSATCRITISEKPDSNAGIVLTTDKMTLQEGQHGKIEATFTPVFDDDDITLTYLSSDESILKVNQDGTFDTFRYGVVTVTVKNTDGQFQKTVTVTVTEKPDPNAGITLDTTVIILEEGQSGKINATFIPVYDADSTTLTFLSSAPSVLKVNADGSFSTFGYGVVTVTVKNADGQFQKTVTVTITEKPDPNAGIVLNQSEITLEEGQSGKINASFIPVYDADDTTLTFLSSDPTVLKVSDDGSFTTFRYGKVTVTVKNANGKFQKTVTVTVTEKPDPNAGITLNQSEIKIQIGKPAQILATFVPLYDADSTILSYESSDPNIAAVDQNGNITAQKAGTVTVTVTNAGGQYSASCTVYVANPGAAVILDKISVELGVGKTDKITANCIPVYDIDDTTLTYTCSDSSIVSVDALGNLKALKAGIATITVQNKDGSLKATCTVMVPNPNAGITLDKNSVEVNVDQTATLNATFVPAYTTDSMTLTYTSKNPAIAKVDANGIITGVAAGSTEIVVTNASGTFTASCLVTVNSPLPGNPNASLTLSHSELVLHVTGNKIATLTVQLIPEYENNQTVTFESSDTSVVTVNENGIVTAQKAGSATITVRNGNLIATCEVTVTAITVGEDSENGMGGFYPYN